MFRNLIILLALTFTFLKAEAQKDTINQTDANGLRQGYWVKKYENGNKQAEGYFKNGKQVGTFKHYQLDGTTPKATMEHIKNTDSTLATFYHENGAMMSKGYYVDQKKEGNWLFYDDRSVMSSREEYKQDKQDGNSTVYHFNGAIAKESSYENGLQQGKFKEFAPNGILLIEGTFLDGNYNDTIKFYYGDGKIKNIGFYQNAVKNGKWTYYGNEGEVLVEEWYINGNLKERKMSEGMEEKAKELQEERKEQFMNSEQDVNITPFEESENE